MRGFFALLCAGLILASLQCSGCGVSFAANGKAGSWIAGPEWNGQEITVDLIEREQIKNIGSKIDGTGMCVFSSIEMAARSQGLEEMRGWRDWCAERYAGGGWPAKVDELLDSWWKAKGILPIPYYQYEGPSPEKTLRLLDGSSRMACVTYGYSPRYGHGISHMVCVSRYRGGLAAVLDNNFIGEGAYEWQSEGELSRRARLTSSSAWVFAWLTAGQPALPKEPTH